MLKALPKKLASFKKCLKQSTVMKFIIQLESCRGKVFTISKKERQREEKEDGKSLSYVLIKRMAIGEDKERRKENVEATLRNPSCIIQFVD